MRQFGDQTGRHFPGPNCIPGGLAVYLEVHLRLIHAGPAKMITTWGTDDCGDVLLTLGGQCPNELKDRIPFQNGSIPGTFPKEHGLMG